MTYYIGIDPGITGAIALVNHKGALCELFDLPTMLKGDIKKPKKCINAKALQHILCAWLAEWGDLIAFVENVHAMPGQGVTSMFNMGETFGTIKSVLTCENIYTNLISPQKWKKQLKLTSDKEECRQYALKMYPNDIHQINRKKDHNRAEAILIARYGALYHDNQDRPF